MEVLSTAINKQVEAAALADRGIGDHTFILYIRTEGVHIRMDNQYNSIVGWGLINTVVSSHPELNPIVQRMEWLTENYHNLPVLET